MTTSVASRQTKPSDHVPQKDGNIEDSAKEESFKQDLNFLCNHCEHKTTDEKQLMQHVKSNHKGFKCDYCKYKTQRKYKRGASEKNRMGRGHMGWFCMTVKWPNPGLFYSDLGRLL